MKVALWGATGVVGQQYVQLLDNHPWFDIVYLAASERSVGKPYGEAVRWLSKEPIPPRIASLPVHALDAADPLLEECSLLFSAAGTASDEEEAARRGLGVITHLASQRGKPDIPLIIPEINAHHLEMVSKQQRGEGWIVAKPNCSIQSYLLPLYALPKCKRVHVTTLQALSGGGMKAMGMERNVIPYIAGEEGKCEWEPRKILGSNAPLFSVQCNRVPVIDGHLACVSVEFEVKPTEEEILTAWENFPSLDLPTAPGRTIYYCKEPDRPQPELDSDTDGGMAISVGRLRSCPLFDYRFVGLSHNAVRGAAGGGLLIAELALTKNYVPQKSSVIA